MNIYKGLLFLDGFRVPADEVEDAAATPRARPAVEIQAPPRPGRRAAVTATTPRWRRMLRGVASAAGVTTPGSSLGRCG